MGVEVIFCISTYRNRCYETPAMVELRRRRCHYGRIVEFAVIFAAQLMTNLGIRHYCVARFVRS